MADERIKLGTKIAYGAPTFAGAGMAIPIAVHLTIFYTDTILLPLGFVAIVKAGARAFDAITDPLMGWISDRWTTRWGRRRPWMAVGGLLCGIAFIGMFTPPSGISVPTAAVWFATTYVLYYLFHTMYLIPHMALGPELTPSYDERSRLFVWREAFLVLGTMIAVITPPILIKRLGDARSAYMWFAIAFGVLLGLLYFNLVGRVKEHPEYGRRKPNPLVPGVRRVMRNRAFRLLLVVYLITSVTGAIPGLMMPYFTKYVIQPENPDKWLGIFLFLYFGTAFVSLPFWLRIALRFGKKKSWLASFIPSGTGALGLFFLGKGDTTACALLVSWAGIGIAAPMFLSPSIQADVIDYDELHTGKRREAQYVALWSIMMKFTVIPSASIPLAILAYVGYVPNVEQTDTVRFTIRAIFGLAPALTSALAFALAFFYPITRDVHTKILRAIDLHREGKSAIDPVSGQEIPPPSERGVEDDAGWFLDHFSRAELEKSLSSGNGALRTGALVGIVASAVAFVVGCVGTARDVHDLHTKPGVLAVLFIVLAGFSLTGICYHAIRWRAAGQMGAKGISPDVVRTHLDVSARLGVRSAAGQAAA